MFSVKPRRSWSTPEKHKLRSYFKSTFDHFKNDTSIRRFPSGQELLRAIQTVPEFRGKTTAILRSKIQHQFNVILRSKQNS